MALRRSTATRDNADGQETAARELLASMSLGADQRGDDGALERGFVPVDDVVAGVVTAEEHLTKMQARTTARTLGRQIR
jgi:hypothetical protein